MTTPLVGSDPARPAQVELAERVADPRPAGPVGDRLASPAGAHGPGRGRAAVGDAREAGPEDERLGPHARARGERLDEAQQKPRVALHRAADVAQDDDRARPPDGAAARPSRRDRRPCRGSGGYIARGASRAAVRMELVPAGEAPLQAWPEQVDEPLGVAELGGVIRSNSRWWNASPGLNARATRSCPHPPPARRRRLRGLGPLGLGPGAARLGPGLLRLQPASRLRRSRRSRRADLEARRRDPRRPAGARTARRPRHRPRGRRAAGRRPPRLPRGPAPVADLHERQRPGEVEPPPRSVDHARRAERPREEDRVAQERRAVERVERVRDGGADSRSSAVPAALLAFPPQPARRGIRPPRHRGPGGRPPRT